MNSMPNSPKPLMTQKSLREPVTDGNMLTDSDQPPKTMIMDYNPSMMEIERDPNIDKLIFQEDDLELKVNRTVDGDLRYLYKGPKNYVITLLLEDLHEINKPLPKLLRIIRRFNQRIDSWFEKRDCCPEHQGVLTFNKDSIIALTIMLIFTIVFSVEVTGVSTAGTSGAGDVFVTYGPLIAFIFLVYGIIFLSLTPDWARTVFIFQTFVPIVLILFDFNILIPQEYPPNIDSTNFCIRLFACILSGVWGIIYPIFRFLKEKHRVVASTFLISVYVGVIYACICKPLMDLIQSGTLTLQHFLLLSQFIYVFTGVMTCYIWIVMHYNYFVVPHRNIERLILKKARTFIKRPDAVPDNLDIHQDRFPFITKVLLNMYWIASLIIGTVFIGVEFLLAFGILLGIKNEDSTTLIACVIFYGLVPAFIILGLPIAVWDRIKPKNKMLYFPFLMLFGFFGLVPLSNIVAKTNLSSLSLYILSGPPVAVFFWQFLALVNLYRRRIFYFLLTFGCLFFWAPVYLIYAFSNTSVFSGLETILNTVAIIFFCVGGGVLAFYLLENFFKLIYGFFKIKILKFMLIVHDHRIRRNYKEIKKIKNQIKAIENVYRDSMRETYVEIEENSDLEGLEKDINESFERGSQEVALSKEKLGSGGKLGSKDGVGSGNDMSKKPSILRMITGTLANLDERPGRGSVEAVMTTEHRVLNDLHKKKRALRATIRAILARDRKIEEDLHVSKNSQDTREANFLQKLRNMIYLNLKNVGYWINASSFVVSFTFIIYSFYNYPSTVTASEQGILYGLTIIMPVIFTIFNFLIRMKSSSVSRRELANFQTGAQADDEEKILFCSKVQAYILIFGIVVIPISLAIALLIADPGSLAYTIRFLIIGDIFFSLVLLGLVEIKKRVGPYHKFIIPLVVSTLWVMVIIPYVVAIPLISALLDNTSEEYATFVKYAIAVTGLFVVITTTTFAVIVNTFLQRVEEEKLAKFIIKHLKRILAKNAILTDDLPLSRLYNTFLRIGEKPLEKWLLRDRRPVLTAPIPEQTRDWRYSHKLLIFERYAAIMRKKDKSKKGESSNKKSLLEKILSCCLDEDDIGEAVAKTNNELPEEEEDEEDSHFKVDKYMPGDFEYDPKGIVAPGLLKKSDTLAPFPRANLDKEDIEFRDHMTAALEAIPHTFIKDFDKDYQLSTEHAWLMERDDDAKETWFQHVYDYFAGKTRIENFEKKSNGMIYNNFAQFMRLSDLDEKIKKEKYQKTFAFNCRMLVESEGPGKYLEKFLWRYFPRRRAQNKTSKDILLSLIIKKNLIEYIYPPIMVRIEGISKDYESTVNRYNTPIKAYPPALGVFEKKEETTNADEDGGNNNNNVLVYDAARKKFKMAPMRAGTRNFTKNLNQGQDNNEIMRENFKRVTRVERKKLSTRIIPGQRKLGKRCARSILFCSRSMGRGCKYAFVTIPSKLAKWIQKKTLGLGLAIGFELDDFDDEIQQENDFLNQGNREAPDWPDVVSIIFGEIHIAKELYEKKEKNKGLKLTFNFPNVSALVGKIYEGYTFIAYAFREEVPWFGSPIPYDVITAPTGEASFIKGFSFLFYLAVTLVFLYAIVAFFAFRALRKGNLGEDETGKKASFPHPMFFLVLGMTILGGSLFTQIMKFLLDAFVCDYSQYPWTLKRDSDIVCLSQEHFGYIILGACCILLYYPTCTFFFPNFQFQNKLLDLKYKPTWFVIFIQVKLILAYFISFFKSSTGTSDSISIQLFGIVSIYTFLAMAVLYFKPCLVKKFNLWDIAIYCLIAYVNGLALFVYYTGQNIIGLVLVGCGTIIIIAICHYSIKYFYGHKKTIKKKKNNRHPIIFDPSKRSPVNEDLEEVRKALKAQQEAEKAQMEADEAKMTEADRKRYIEEREFELKLMEGF